MPLEISLDYLLPYKFPVFVGTYFITPNPNLKNFGIRTGYHVDLRMHKTNFYIFYVFDFGFIRNDLLIEYNDDPVDINFYDFRFGFRHFFNNRMGIVLESAFKLQGLNMGITYKLF